MTTVTDAPVAPFSAVLGTAGAWPERFTYWEVVDAQGRTPAALIDAPGLRDETWCREQADRLNREHEAEARA